VLTLLVCAAKAYLRLGKIQHLTKEYQKALRTFDIGLDYEPDSSEIKQARIDVCMHAPIMHDARVIHARVMHARVMHACTCTQARVKEACTHRIGMHAHIGMHASHRHARTHRHARIA